MGTVICTLIFCLRLGAIAPALSQLGEPERLIQQGLDAYYAGDYHNALAFWKNALRQAPNLETRLDLYRYQARAYQKTGQTIPAIDEFDRLITAYQQLQRPTDLGHMLTEQAQIAADLGQYDWAVALLCGQSEPNQPPPQTCLPDSAVAIAMDQNDGVGLTAALGALGSAFFEQAQYEAAIATYQRAYNLAVELKHFPYQIAALSQLGALHYRLMVQNERYTRFAEGKKDWIAAKNFRAAVQTHTQESITALQEALQLPQPQTERLERLLNLVSVSRYQPSMQAITQAALAEARSLVNQMPLSQDQVYDLLRVGFLEVPPPQDFLREGAPALCENLAPTRRLTGWVRRAVLGAQRLQDAGLESVVRGHMGHLYECQGDYKTAQDWTRQAQVLGQDKGDRYLWNWQAARILLAQGNEAAALKAYQYTLDSLKGVRGVLSVSTRDRQPDFYSVIAPIYRQLSRLLVRSVAYPGAFGVTAWPDAEAQKRLINAVQIIDELHLLELQNYLGKVCEPPPELPPITPGDTHTAIITTLVFEEATAVVVAIPNVTPENPIQPREGQADLVPVRSELYWIPLKRTELIEQVNEFRSLLGQRSDRANGYLKGATQFYDWLIRPVAAQLQAAGIDTLVFMQDGILRSIPMAPLFDGEQFLVEQYALGIAPILSEIKPLPLVVNQIQALPFGLTQPAELANGLRFPALDYVDEEVNTIADQFVPHQGLFNEKFTRLFLGQMTHSQPAQLLHLATHAQFGYDARQTFLILGKPEDALGSDALTQDLPQNLPQNSPQQKALRSTPEQFNETLTIQQLADVVQQAPEPIRLLTLSACETAVGSDRDILGISGMMFQSGVQSSLASLWRVDDEATAQMMIQFYQVWQQGMGRAAALQTMQRDWIARSRRSQFSHPGYWAAFIAVGNWL